MLIEFLKEKKYRIHLKRHSEHMIFLRKKNNIKKLNITETHAQR